MNMKKLVVLVLVAVAVSSKLQAVDVVVEPNPYPTEPDGVMAVLTGKLTDVVDQLQARIDNGEKEIGLHSMTYTYSVGQYLPHHEKKCCVDAVTEGKYMTYEITKLKVTVTYDRIFLPIWTDRQSNCASATNEWNAFYTRVEDHEKGHREVSKEFFKPDHIKTLASLFEWRFETPCTKLADYDAQKAREEITKKFQESWNGFGAELESDYNHHQEVYHQQVGESIAIPSKTAECP